MLARSTLVQMDSYNQHLTLDVLFLIIFLPLGLVRIHGFILLQITVALVTWAVLLVLDIWQILHLSLGMCPVSLFIPALLSKTPLVLVESVLLSCLGLQQSHFQRQAQGPHLTLRLLKVLLSQCLICYVMIGTWLVAITDYNLTWIAVFILNQKEAF